jgi:hypothetical protein
MVAPQFIELFQNIKTVILKWAIWKHWDLEHLRLMIIGTLPCVKISLDYWVFGLLPIIWHSERYTNILLYQRLTLWPYWINTSTCFDLRMEAGSDSKKYCSVFSAKYWRQSRHPVILSITCHCHNHLDISY